jgi:hypothetical protein
MALKDHPRWGRNACGEFVIGPGFSLNLMPKIYGKCFPQRNNNVRSS